MKRVFAIFALLVVLGSFGFAESTDSVEYVVEIYESDSIESSEVIEEEEFEKAFGFTFSILGFGPTINLTKENFDMQFGLSYVNNGSSLLSPQADFDYVAYRSKNGFGVSLGGTVLMPFMFEKDYFLFATVTAMNMKIFKRFSDRFEIDLKTYVPVLFFGTRYRGEYIDEDEVIPAGWDSSFATIFHDGAYNLFLVCGTVCSTVEFKFYF